MYPLSLHCAYHLFNLLRCRTIRRVNGRKPDYSASEQASRLRNYPLDKASYACYNRTEPRTSLGLCGE
jgi:hypothetical protein